MRLFDASALAVFSLRGVGILGLLGVVCCFFGGFMSNINLLARPRSMLGQLTEIHEVVSLEVDNSGDIWKLIIQADWVAASKTCCP